MLASLLACYDQSGGVSIGAVESLLTWGSRLDRPVQWAEDRIVQEKAEMVISQNCESHLGSAK